MIKIITKILFFSIIIGFLLFLNINICKADNGVYLSPSKVVVDLTYDNEWESYLVLKNSIDKKIKLVAFVEDIKFENGKMIRTKIADPNRNYYSLSEWISIRNNKIIELQPNETLKVPYTIEIPIVAEPGEYNSAIFFREYNDSEVAGLSLKYEIGTIVNLTLYEDDRNSHVVYEDFSLNKFINIGHSLNVYSSIVNKGNVHAKVADIEYNLFNVFTGYEQNIKYSFNGVDSYLLPGEIFKVEKDFEIGYGLYIIESEVRFSNEIDRFDDRSQSLYFVMISRSIKIGFFVICSLLILVLIWKFFIYDRK